MELLVSKSSWNQNRGGLQKPTVEHASSGTTTRAVCISESDLAALHSRDSHAHGFGSFFQIGVQGCERQGLAYCQLQVSSIVG